MNFGSLISNRLFLWQDDDRMSAFVIAETLKKYDANKDGVLSKDEFFGKLTLHYKF